MKMLVRSGVAPIARSPGTPWHSRHCCEVIGCEATTPAAAKISSAGTARDHVDTMRMPDSRLGSRSAVQGLENRRVLLLHGQQVVTCRAVLADGPPLRSRVQVVVTPEAATVVAVAEHVRIGIPADLHLREHVAGVDLPQHRRRGSDVARARRGDL